MEPVEGYCEYGRIMAEEPRNAASELTRCSVGWLNDRDFVVRAGTTMVAPDFVRIDHRRLVAQPPVGAEAWVAGLFDLENVAGAWPFYELTEVVAVRGDRACASRWLIQLGDFEVEYLVVNACDETGERFATIHFFDPEDIDAALVELDRLHAELETEGAGPSSR